MQLSVHFARTLEYSMRVWHGRPARGCCRPEVRKKGISCLILLLLIVYTRISAQGDSHEQLQAWVTRKSILQRQAIVLKLPRVLKA